MVMRIAVLLSIALALATPVSAGSPHALRAAISAGAGRLVLLQNADGGWFFTVGDADCGLGAGVSCANTIGVTALGLADAYQVTHDSDHLAAAAQAADALVARHGAAPPCDGNPATGADRPFTVDASFLTDISHLGKVGRVVGAAARKNYRDVAKEWFSCVTADFPSAADRADNRINGRIAQGLSNLGAWDASLDVRAAMDVGQRPYALAEAVQIVARAGDWDVADAQCPGCEILSKGLFLAATHELQGDAVIRDARTVWKAGLLASQLPNGSWADDTQITAYVTMGLAATSQDKATRSAISAAVAFLLTQQQAHGGFTLGGGSTDEITEVDSEVLQALSASR